MRHFKFFFILLFLLGSFSISAQSYNVTFQVDMNTVDPTTFTTPEVNGTFNGWCGNCAAMSDVDGDNVWEITIALSAGAYEFKYSADNWSIQESLYYGDSCTNGNQTYTNRLLTVSGDTTLPVVCWGSCDDCSTGPSSYSVTFEVDMRGVTDPFTTPEVNGTFNGWCGNCWAMTDSDGDSIWQFTTVFSPGDSLEWKYSADNWSIQEDLDSNLSCIVINYDPSSPNGWGYVNRVAVVDSDTTFSAPWNSCGLQLETLSQIDLPISWDDTTVDYTVTDFGGSSSTISTDPLDPSNNVLMTDRTAGSQTWAGTTLSTPSGLLNPIPFTSGATTISTSVYSSLSGITVRLKAEDHTDPTKSVETEAVVTTANGWSTLVFDFSNEASGTAIIDFSYTYDMLSIFFDFGNVPSSSTIYYLDSVVFGGIFLGINGCTDTLASNYDSLATIDDGSCTYFSMGCTDSLACNYDPLAMLDDGSCLVDYGCMDSLALNYDSLATCPDSCIFPQGTSGCTDSIALNYNPLATVDDSSCVYCLYGCIDSTACNFDSLATCDDGSCLTSYGCIDSLACNYDPLANCDDGNCLTNYGCTDSLALNYNPLSDCDDGGCFYGYSVTFQLDLRGVTSISYIAPEINGVFNGWCGSCTQLEDLNNDSIWDVTIVLDSGSYEYKYSSDNWSIQENLFQGSPCTVTNTGFTNRLVNVSQDTVLDPVCWELCGDCNSSGPLAYNVTFRLDMSEYIVPFTTPEVNGTFNGWCGNCWAMEDIDGDNIWEFTSLIMAGDTIQYKYSTDDWSSQEGLDSSLSCVITNYDPGAPNGWGYVNRFEIINSETILDVVCWDDCVECQAQTAIYNEGANETSIYPNPSTGPFYIQSDYKIEKLIIFNSLGETVLKKEKPLLNSEHKIELATNGLYFISIYTDGVIINKKIAIQIK